MPHVVIVGAGHAGVNTAAQLRKLDPTLDITLLSNEAHMPYHRPPLSKHAVFDPNLPMQLLQPDGYFDKHNINLRLNTHVTAIHPLKRHVTIQDHKEYRQDIVYDQLIIATGSSNRRMGISGETLAHSIYTYADIQALGPKLQDAKRVVVIGGGFIGCEFAAGALVLNKQVTLLMNGDRLLKRVVAPAIGKFVTQWHQQQGMTIHEHCQVLSITPSGVETKQGFITADLVVIGVGATANIDLAQHAQLTTNQGIVTDSTGKTSDENIYALGDVAEFPFRVPFPITVTSNQTLTLPCIQNATDQAVIIAHNIVAANCQQTSMTMAVTTNIPKEYCPVPWFWSDQGLLKLQMAGLSHPQATHEVLPDSQASQANGISPQAMTIVHLLNNQLIAVDTINAPGNHLAARKLLAMSSPIDWQAIIAADYDLKSLFKSLK